MLDNTVLLAQMTFAHDSGLAEDVAVNTFHFLHHGLVDDFDNVRDMVRDFYDAIPAGSAQRVSASMSSALSGAWTLKLYDLTDAMPRVPKATYTGTLAGLGGGGQNLPSEVALCCSWKAAVSSGEAAARFRGRTFVGPLSATNALGPSGIARPDATFLTSVVNAGKALVAAGAASVVYDFVVYSPTRPGAPGSGAKAAVITGGWVDNAFDTQRRRGEKATARTVFP